MKTKKITERIKGFFKTNISFKIFSLIFAFVMWFIVMSSLNPSETKTYSVTLTVNGAEDLAESDLVCLNLEELQSQVVRVKIKATRPDLNSLDNNKDKLTAMIDLGRLTSYAEEDLSKGFNVSVIPNLSVYSSSYEIVGYSPSGLTAELDRLVEFTVPIRVSVLNETEAGYIHGDLVPSVSTVTVKGPETLADTVAYASLEVDLSGLTYDTAASVMPVLYDEDGKAVDTNLFTVDSGSIDVAVEIMKEGEVRVEAPQFTGSAASGYSVTDVIVEPEILKVLGKENAQTGTITLPSVNINGAAETIERIFNVEELLAEKGLEAASDEFKNVKVQIVIEQEDPAVVVIPGSAISITGLGEGLELGEALSGVSIEVYGNKDTIAAADITGRIDLSGLSEGMHTVEVEPVLPGGTSLVDSVYIEVELVSTEVTEEETTEETTEEPETEEIITEEPSFEEESVLGE
ncbi:MAG: hypothetical protein LIO87_08365 [Eubacterium sp.]|nr:hypothetical protein [Eubacterium sp.]